MIICLLPSPKKYFYNSNIKLNYSFTCKLTGLEITLVASDGHISSAIILPSLKNCNWLKKLCAYCVNDHFVQNFEIFFKWQNKFPCLLACDKAISRCKNRCFSSEILHGTTVGSIRKGFKIPGKMLVCGWY